MRYIKDDKREQKRLERIIAKMSVGPHVAVGILQDDKVNDDFSMVDLAIVHEYGSKDGHIPSRSFIRSTCDARRQEHIKLVAKLQDSIIASKKTIGQALTTLGEVVSKNMVQTINRGITPGNALSTKKRKKSKKPLIDTGNLKGSITHEVRGVS